MFIIRTRHSLVLWFTDFKYDCILKRLLKGLREKNGDKKLTIIKVFAGYKWPEYGLKNIFLFAPGCNTEICPWMQDITDILEKKEFKGILSVCASGEDECNKSDYESWKMKKFSYSHCTIVYVPDDISKSDVVEIVIFITKHYKTEKIVVYFQKQSKDINPLVKMIPEGIIAEDSNKAIEIALCIIGSKKIVR